MDDNSEFAGKNPFNSPKSRAPLGVRSVFDFNVDCAGLGIEDFGRESLGIIDLAHPDFRRDSLSFLYDPRKEELRRESLGIISLNDDWKPKNQFGPPGITVTDLGGSPTDSLLNTAFMASSLPSDDSAFSVNLSSWENEGPSRIFSTCSGNSSVLNQAFEDSAGFFKLLLSERYHNLFKSHPRVKSLPSNLEVATEMSRKLDHIEEKNFDFEELQEKRKIKSDTSLLDANQAQDFVKEDDKFDDSVFLEANHLAHKVASTSVLSDGDMLDCTQEPADLMTEISEDESVKCDSETVFKTVDKMLPPQTGPLDNNPNENTKVPVKKDESNVSNNNKSNSSSRDPQEIINSLSELLNRVSPTEQQKAVGQNLLSNLAEIINGNSTASNHLDDSGHSSSEGDLICSQNECYEVLDLRKKVSFESSVSQSESCEVCVPLDLSLKSKSANSEKEWSPKMLPPKTANNQRKLLGASSLGSNCSVSSNESKRGIDQKIKFKPRKIEEKTTFRKGPLKAVIPVSSMARRKSVQGTPPKTELPTPKYSLKKTSTPIHKFNVKPVAQSTPEGCLSAISPLNTPNSSPRTTKQKLNYSGSSPHNRSLNLPKSFIRRHSVSDMKQNQGGGRFMRRSNSVGENSGLAATAIEVKQNIAKTARRTSVTSKSVLQENRNRSTIKASVGKKVGKENVC